MVSGSTDCSINYVKRASMVVCGDSYTPAIKIFNAKLEYQDHTRIGTPWSAAYIRGDFSLS